MHKLLLAFILLNILGCSGDDEPEIVITPKNLAPSQFEISPSEITDRSGIIIWTQSVDPENSNITYDIYLNNELIEQNVTDLSYTFENLSADTQYTAKVIASDGSNKTTVSYIFKTQAANPIVSEGEVLLLKKHTFDNGYGREYMSFEYEYYEDGRLKTRKWTTFVSAEDPEKNVYRYNKYEYEDNLITKQSTIKTGTNPEKDDLMSKYYLEKDRVYREEIFNTDGSLRNYKLYIYSENDPCGYVREENYSNDILKSYVTVEYLDSNCSSEWTLYTNDELYASGRALKNENFSPLFRAELGYYFGVYGIRDTASQEYLVIPTGSFDTYSWVAESTYNEKGYPTMEIRTYTYGGGKETHTYEYY